MQINHHVDEISIVSMCLYLEKEKRKERKFVLVSMSQYLKL